MYFRPWAGYYARPAHTGGFYWGPPIGISTGFLFGAFDWPRRQVSVERISNEYYWHRADVNRGAGARPAYDVWQHEPEHHRRIADHGIEVQQRFGAPNAAQIQGNNARPADPQRSTLRADVHAAAGPATHAEASANGRPGDMRTAVQAQAATPLAPPQRPAAAWQPAASNARFERSRDGRDGRAIAHPAPPAPVLPAPATVRTATIERSPKAAWPAPAAQPAAAAHPAPLAPPARAARADRPSAGQAAATAHDALRRAKQGL